MWPKGAKAALMSSVLISGLRSPTNTWKWPKAQEKPKNNKLLQWKSIALDKFKNEQLNTYWMCLFSGSSARWPNLLWPPDNKETTEEELETMTQAQVKPRYNSSGQTSTKATRWGNLTSNQMVLPFLISSSCSWLQEPKQHLCGQRTPQSNKGRCLYALKTIK